MEQLVRKYVDKIDQAGLAQKEDIYLAGLEVDIFWNQASKIQFELEFVINQLNISSLLFVKPAEPYRSIIDQLAILYPNFIKPSDTESRTFLHEICVIDTFDINHVVDALKQQKCVVIKNFGIITTGSLTPEQCFVTLSSVCFACFVKYFLDYYQRLKSNINLISDKTIFDQIVGNCDFYHQKAPNLQQGPFKNEDQVIKAMVEVGKSTVDYRLVDSYFGNLSYFDQSTIYISQSGSSLDELSGYIDPVPIDNSKTIGLTASSELSAHKSIYENSDLNIILHGHPKFSVILSMMCDKEDCENSAECHIKCTSNRMINSVPVVTGEVGNGPYGLCHTVPKAIEQHQIALVYGHGVFVGSKGNFKEAFKHLFDFEKECQITYFNKIQDLSN